MRRLIGLFYANTQAWAYTSTSRRHGLHLAGMKIAHYRFVTIHPFDDGNGRIARAIADMQLARADRDSQRSCNYLALHKIQYIHEVSLYP